MFGANVSVLRSIGALRIIVTFDCVHPAYDGKIMKVTDVLCQTLQKKPTDILNAVECVSTTKVLLGEL